MLFLINNVLVHIEVVVLLMNVVQVVVVLVVVVVVQIVCNVCNNTGKGRNLIRTVLLSSDLPYKKGVCPIH